MKRISDGCVSRLGPVDKKRLAKLQEAYKHEEKLWEKARGGSKLEEKSARAAAKLCLDKTRKCVPAEIHQWLQAEIEKVKANWDAN